MVANRRFNSTDRVQTGFRRERSNQLDAQWFFAGLQNVRDDLALLAAELHFLRGVDESVQTLHYGGFFDLGDFRLLRCDGDLRLLGDDGGGLDCGDCLRGFHVTYSNISNLVVINQP